MHTCRIQTFVVHTDPNVFVSFLLWITMGIIHSASSIGKISPAASILSTSFLTFSFILGLSQYGLCFIGLESGFNSIFISPMDPFIPFSSENVFGNKSSYSRNKVVYFIHSFLIPVISYRSYLRILCTPYINFLQL
jgi:hypothetical protein